MTNRDFTQEIIKNITFKLYTDFMEGFVALPLEERRNAMFPCPQNYISQTTLLKLLYIPWNRLNMFCI